MTHPNPTAAKRKVPLLRSGNPPQPGKDARRTRGEAILPKLGRVAVVSGLLTLALLPVSRASESEGAGSSSSSNPVDIALDHARKQREALGLTEADVADLLVIDVVRSQHTGMTHVYLRQRHEGLEVQDANMTVNVAADGTVIHAPSRFLPNLASIASGIAALGPAEAVAAAAVHLDLELTEPLEVLHAGGDPARETILSEGGIALSPISAKLVYQPIGADAMRLAWNLEIEEISQEHWWNVSVDAETADLLAKYDYVDHDNAEATAAAVAETETLAPASDSTPATAGVDDGSSYRVFALPLESPNDGDRALVDTPADAVASPFGWHDTDGQEGPEFTVTRGNNASAYLDTTNAGTPLPGTQAEGGEDLTFDFPFDPTLPPTANKDAATTNLFYWNNTIHDVFYHYGFDEEAGNFQVNNYGQAGIDGDDVRAEAQDGSGVNNANFATPPDGSRPRMQMFVWTTGVVGDQEIIDGDFDAGVIVHEYGHGISNRLTGGPNTTSCLGNQERPSEGWSDWLAIAMLALPSESGEQPRGLGTYVLNEDSRQDGGIRPTPYSTDMSINPTTYDDIKTLAVPHGVGYVWATMTWEMFWALVEEHGFNPDVRGDWTTGGNNLAIQLVMDGMKLQPCNPGFVDARDAILAADVALTGGENQCVIWSSFAKRGLGFRADQGSPNSRDDGAEAFDTHPTCTGAPLLSFAPTPLVAEEAFGGDGDGFFDNCEVWNVGFQVSNIGSGSLTNVRIVAVATPSHPMVEILTSPPATIASSLPEGGIADGELSILGVGLGFDETLEIQVTVTSDELGLNAVTRSYFLGDLESDLAFEEEKRFTFEADLEGWELVQGTFDRESLGGGADLTSFYLASSSLAANQCDQIRSPVMKLTQTSELSLFNQFEIEPESDSFFDRANVGIFNPSSGSRTVVSPDGGRLYNASGSNGVCVTADLPGWAGVGPAWLESTWSAEALGSSALADEVVRLDVAYGTDPLVEGTGFWFDEVTVTNVFVQSPDTQSDECSVVACDEIDDDDAAVEYRRGWHRRSHADASGGGYHRRMGANQAGNGASPTARLVFTGDAITYHFATSDIGGTADIFIDGAFMETVSYDAGGGTKKENPTFGHMRTYDGLGEGPHELRIEHRSGAVYVDGFSFSCDGDGGPDAAAAGFHSETVTDTAAATEGLVIERTVDIGELDEEVSVVVEGALVALTVNLLDPAGDLLASGEALVDGLTASGLDAPVATTGTYTVQVVNTSGAFETIEISVARMVRNP